MWVGVEKGEVWFRMHKIRKEEETSEKCFMWKMSSDHTWEVNLEREIKLVVTWKISSLHFLPVLEVM